VQTGRVPNLSSPELAEISLAGCRDAVYRRDIREGRYEFLSPLIEQLTGLTPDQFGALPFKAALSRVHPDDRAQVVAALKPAGAGGMTVTTFRFRHVDGRYRQLQDHTEVVTDDTGAPLYRFGYFRDVTEPATAAALRPAPRVMTLPLRVRRSGVATPRWDRSRIAWRAGIAAGVLLAMGLAATLPGRFRAQAPLVAALPAADRAPAASDGPALRDQSAPRRPAALRGKAREAPVSSRRADPVALARALRPHPEEAAPPIGDPAPVADPAPATIQAAWVPPVPASSPEPLRRHFAALPQPVAADPPYAR
jgi:PAS domain S-box-containing protein